MEQETNKFKQANAFAMQYGFILGCTGILSLFLTGLSLSVPSISFLGTLVTLASPLLAAMMTRRFRNAVMTTDVGFTFGRGFLFTFVMGVYAILLVGLFTFIYLAFIDGGYIFNAYERLLSQPEVVAEMRRSGMLSSLTQGGMDMTDIVDTMRSIPPAQYASSIICTSILMNPFISAVIALVMRRDPGFIKRTEERT